MSPVLALTLLLGTADNTSAAAPTPRPAKERKVCRQLDTTGSRMRPPPVCKTAGQWEADAELTRKTLEFRQRRDGR